MAVLTEILIVAQSRFQIDALHLEIADRLDGALPGVSVVRLVAVDVVHHPVVRTLLPLPLPLLAA